MKYQPYPYQAFATSHLIDNPAAGLFLEMGLGKSVSTMTAIDQLLNDYFDVSRVLVIAPKRVADSVWTDERDKWDHLRHLRISKVLGTEKQRRAALKVKADIYTINRENVVWLIAQYGTAFPFDMVVLDESSSFKSPKSARFKALRTVRPLVKRVVLLTGTPAPNSLLDLWSQLYLLDQGKRLEETLTDFRSRYFRVKNPYEPFADYEVIREEDELIGESYYERKIYDRISDICISMKAEDYLQLPERIDRMVPVHLSDQNQMAYDEFEKTAVLELLAEQEEGKEISAINAGALTTKLIQFANGAVYDEDKNVHEVHDEKLEQLSEIIEAAAGHPVLVFYWFKHDLSRIQRHLKALKPVKLESDADIKAWNAGKVQVLLAHPGSAGHGLNLQAGGNIIVWFGLTWSLELYQQANARLHRQGQTRAVIVHHLVAINTVDQDVMLAIEGKAKGQDALMCAVKARIEKYRS